MHRIVLPLALLPSLLVGGCEGSNLQWVKEGADARALAADQDACQREAQRFAFLGPGNVNGYEGQGGNRMAAFGEADSYRACMGQRGWHRERRG